MLIGGAQERKEKNSVERETAGCEHRGAAGGAGYPLAPLADQRPDSFFALLLEVILAALAQGNRFLSKVRHRLDAGDFSLPLGRPRGSRPSL